MTFTSETDALLFLLLLNQFTIHWLITQRLLTHLLYLPLISCQAVSINQPPALCQKWFNPNHHLRVILFDNLPCSSLNTLIINFNYSSRHLANQFATNGAIFHPPSPTPQIVFIYSLSCNHRHRLSTGYTIPPQRLKCDNVSTELIPRISRC